MDNETEVEFANSTSECFIPVPSVTEYFEGKKTNFLD